MNNKNLIMKYTYLIAFCMQLSIFLHAADPSSAARPSLRQFFRKSCLPVVADYQAQRIITALLSKEYRTSALPINTDRSLDDVLEDCALPIVFRSESARFTRFVENILQDCKLPKRLILKYPELKKMVVNSLQNWKNRSAESSPHSLLQEVRFLYIPEITELLLRIGVKDLYNDEIDVFSTALFGLLNPKVAQLLIDFGSNIEQQNQSGQTPLFWQFNSEAMKVLIDAGANVNAISRTGRKSVLEHYAQINFIDNVVLLLDSGAHIGNTAHNLFGSDLFPCRPDSKMLRLLVKYGADVYRPVEDQRRWKSSKTIQDLCAGYPELIAAYQAGLADREACAPAKEFCCLS